MVKSLPGAGKPYLMHMQILQARAEQCGDRPGLAQRVITCDTKPVARVKTPRAENHFCHGDPSVALDPAVQADGFNDRNNRVIIWRSRGDRRRAGFYIGNGVSLVTICGCRWWRHSD